MIFLFILILSSFSSKIVEYRLSRNFGDYIYDFSGNNQHSKVCSNASSKMNPVKFTSRGVFLEFSSGIKSNIRIPSLLIPNPATLMIWSFTFSEGILFSQYEKGKNEFRFEKGDNSDMKIRLYSEKNVKVLYGLEGSFLSSNS